MNGDHFSEKFVNRSFRSADIFSIDICSMRRFSQWLMLRVRLSFQFSKIVFLAMARAVGVDSD